MDEEILLFNESKKPTSDIVFSSPKVNLYISKISVEPTIQDFKEALLKCKLLDSINVDFYGSHIILPKGLSVFNQFYIVIKDKYKKFGLEEYDFPSIVSTDIFKKSNSIFKLEDKLLHVGNDSSFRENRPIGTLTPTGEQIIYSYWSKIINKESDLPVKLFKKSKFYRPISKNFTKSIFSSAEASDLFEFHCAYSNFEDKQLEIEKSIQMFEEIYKDCYVPIIKVERPLWTNNTNVSKRTVGFDSILPNLKTIQVGSIYDQEQIFSKVYNVTFKENGIIKNTFQITGALSRRLVLTSLFLGLKTNKSIFIHPNLNPVQVEIKLKIYSEERSTEIIDLQRQMDSSGLRYDILNTIDSQTSIASLRVIVFDKRNKDDKYKVVFIRNDSESEYIEYFESLKSIPQYCLKIIDILKYDYSERLKFFFNNNSSFKEHKQDLLGSDVTKGIKYFYAKFDYETVKIIEDKLKGEVLGFIKSKNKGQCIINNKLVDHLCFFSKRI